MPVLVGISGAQAALIGTALLSLAFLALAWRRLRTIDDAADVPQVQIQLLRLIPMFAPLPAPELEGLARALEPVHVAAGTTVIREGDAGDRFYAVAAGELHVTKNGHDVSTLRRGRRLRRDRPDRGRTTHRDGHRGDRRGTLLARPRSRSSSL